MPPRSACSRRGCPSPGAVPTLWRGGPPRGRRRRRAAGAVPTAIVFPSRSPVRAPAHDQCPRVRFAVLLVLLTAVLAPPAAGQQSGSELADEKLYFPPCPEYAADYTFDCYHDYEEVGAFLKQAADAHPELASLQSLGESYQGREVWMMTITDPTTGVPSTKPALWVDGGIDANEVVSVEAALGVVHRLLESDTDRVREVTGYDLATSVYDWNWPPGSGNRKSGQIWRDADGTLRGGSSYPAPGGSLDGMYLNFGVVAFANEIYSMGTDYDGDGTITEAEQLRYSDEEMGGYALKEFEEYEHPTLGTVEIGGWRKFGYNNPPPAEHSADRGSFVRRKRGAGGAVHETGRGTPDRCASHLASDAP
jgi:hypothetical protein